MPSIVDFKSDTPALSYAQVLKCVSEECRVLVGTIYEAEIAVESLSSQALEIGHVEAVKLQNLDQVGQVLSDLQRLIAWLADRAPDHSVGGQDLVRQISLDSLSARLFGSQRLRTKSETGAVEFF